ncbi:MAG: FG-GAP-like repeat-containing protein [Rubripirellula sp.]|nr:FG-GAP-like repeat-containing protein [Rubripirellula sp.]
MRAAVAARDWVTAAKYSKLALIESPDDPDLIAMAAAITAFQGNKREAAGMLAEAARIADYQPMSRVEMAVSGLVGVGEIYPAIELLEASLEKFPDRNKHRQMVVSFWNEMQRTDKIPPHLQELIEQRSFSLALLVTTTETGSRRLSEKTSERLEERNPNDLRSRLADAFVLLYRRNAAEAVEMLQQILERHPDFAPAHAMYGQALAASLRWSDIPAWVEQSVPGSGDFADHWLTLGDFALEQQEPAQAVRAYWEATRKDPNQSIAWDRLRLAIQRLRASDSPRATEVTDQQVAVISEHADRLLAAREAFNDFTGSMESQTGAMQLAEALAKVGRLWEAEAWSAIATTMTKQPSNRLETVRQGIVAKLQRDPSWIAKETPAHQLDFSNLPLPVIDAERSAFTSNLIVPRVVTHDHILVKDVTNQVGLSGVGDGNDPSDPRLAALIRSTGTGGGSFDYDLDGWPDLLVMNAGGSMLELDSLPNQLMRNLEGQFVPVGKIAGIDDTHYGQGLAVGDFNEDGFADLFFANLGENLLLRNNGDGTFTDCTENLAGNRIRSWSTSGSFVDINGDAVADLITTQYCLPVAKLPEPCAKENGELGPCHPLTFPADTDQFFAGSPAGEFVEVTKQWVGEPIPGRGLGVLSGALDGRSLGIFVANDMSRNSFYAPVEPSDGRSTNTKLVDSGSARGVAVDGRSQAQASMGIAASDLDHDGDLDLYVTGFGREYNIYYEQIAPGLWKDETAKLNLIEPTLSLVGFGTQAIDLDSDGIDELVITNGNIGEFMDPDRPYEQPIQFFRRDRDGRFAELDDDSWGDYFRNSHVGRALWMSDVNRDGRNDLVVTHTREQIGLLMNESSDQNSRIAFKLTATRSSRDAVGAVIRFTVNGKQRVMWMLSGDGYFCSNEKTLIAGIGEANEVTDVSVTWQDGSVDDIGTLPANTQQLIIEGAGEAFTLCRYPSAK